MSNAFFYVFIYFLGYYGSNVLNMLTVLVTVGAIYFMWRSKDKQDEDSTEAAQSSIDQQATESAETRTTEIPEQEAQASKKPGLSDTKQSLQDSNKTQN